VSTNSFQPASDAVHFCVANLPGSIGVDNVRPDRSTTQVPGKATRALPVSNTSKRRQTRLSFLEEYGLVLGAALLLLVGTCAILLGRKAARGVEEFREEHHESFLGSDRK